MPRQAFAWGVLRRCEPRYAAPNRRSASAKVAMTAATGLALQLGQTRQQVQRVNIFRGPELWADQVQVACRGAGVTMSQ